MKSKSPPSGNAKTAFVRAGFLALWRVLAVFATVTSISVPCFAQVTSIWNNTSGNWSDFTLWSTDPLFPNNGNGGNDYNAEFNGGTATLDQDIEIEGLTFGGGTITGDFDLTLNGPLSWMAGTISGSGTTTLTSGGTLNANGQVVLSRLLVNDGTFNFSNSQLLMKGGSFQNNATFIASSASSHSIISDSFGSNTFNNAGTFIKNGTGQISMSFSSFSDGLTFNNSGLVDVQQGGLYIYSDNFGGPTHSGDFAIASGATLFFAGNHNFTSSTNVSGGGTLQIGGANGGGIKTFDGQLSPEGTVNITAGQLYINSTTAAKSLNINSNLSGGLAGTGNVTFNNINWSSGRMFGTGTTTLAAGGTLTLNGSVTLNRKLVNEGSATMTDEQFGGRQITIDDGIFQNNGAFTVDANGTFFATTITTPFGNTAPQSSAFNNAGVFTKLGSGTMEITRSFDTHSFPFSNTGTVDVQEGILRLSSGSGVMQHVGSELTGGTWYIHDGATLDITTGSTITTNLADITLDGIGSSFTKIDNSLIDNQSSFSILNGRDFTASSTFSNSGSLTVGAGSTFTAPAISQHVGTELTGGTWNIGGTLSVTGSNITTNHGDVTLDGPSSTFSQIDSLVDNRGSFAIKNGRNFTPSGPFSNSGALTIGTGGTFDATGGFTQTATGTLRGSGIFKGNLTNSGRLAPGNSPGIINIDGDYTQTSTGVLEIEVGGLVADPMDPQNAEHDLVVVDGNAALDGRLDVPIVDGFVPQVGQSITFLTTTGTLSGEFASVFSPNLGTASPNVALEVQYNAASAQVNFVTPLTNIQFDASTASADFADAGTWDIGVEPGIRNIIEMENLAGVDQQVNVQSDDAYLHQLSVAGDTHSLTLAIKNSQSLSAIAGTTVEHNAAIELGDGSTLGQLVSSMVDIQDGGLLAGNGTIKANSVTVSGGTISPGFSIGHLDIDGDFELTNNGEMVVEIDSETMRDTIAVTGEAVLGGKLTIDLTDSSLQPGDKSVIATAESFTFESLFELNVIGDPERVIGLLVEELSPEVAALSGVDLDPGDMNGVDGITTDDIPLFALALRNPEAYIQEIVSQGMFLEPNDIGNVDRQGKLDFDDIDDFAAALQMSPLALLNIMSRMQLVPEPNGLVLALFCLVFLQLRMRELTPNG